MGGQSQGRGKLVLTVTRKSRHAPRRNCFKVKVADQSGAVVEGATVRFAHKSKLTRQNGTTRVCRRIHGPRRPAISAAKQGYDGASQRVRIRPHH